MDRAALAALSMCLVRESVDAGCIDPAVIEVEQRAYRAGVVDRLVNPAGFIYRPNIVRYFGGVNAVECSRRK
ncbi:MAG: hypothetical protein ACR2JB_02625 [Bryobacteraceae bacterium]